MMGGMVPGIVSGASPAQPVAWRLLRLADALEAAWAGAAKVQTEAQDADGWITLGLRNNAPAADFPAKMAFHSFPILNPDGSPVDPETLSPARALVLLLQRDATTWPGSAAQETVALGVVDSDGDLTDVAATGLLIGVRTPAAAATYTLIAGAPTAASTFAPASGSRAFGSLVIAPGQSGAIIAGAMTEAGAIVGGTQAESVGATSGNRRIVLATGCNSATNNGPHPVRFRCWYALLPSAGYPWSDPA